MKIAQIKKEISLLTTAIENALQNGGVTTMKFENIEIGLSLTVLYDRRDRQKTHVYGLFVLQYKVVDLAEHKVQAQVNVRGRSFMLLRVLVIPQLSTWIAVVRYGVPMLDVWKRCPELPAPEYVLFREENLHYLLPIHIEVAP